ncbi:iron-containing alcohol dehydrogenase [Patulibacter sp.]|uniref:iron-containing alcohol dehydrogenase n=1 Tax=Patulibacter sp. TaxID=1912859 RepID=UPI00271A7BCF|nr:iron-containing alcohol dehydrogenase [Patulibacter sp.]MDO9407273.1 iron-containing alcohol dehydrogenase [Patulibacter sp.]
MTGAWWQAPVVLRFGVGTVADVGGATVPMGRRVVLVTDERLDVAPPVAAVSRSLAAAGALVVRHVLPVGEPDPAVVAGLADELRRTPADVVVAVGGGSVLDAAKLGVVGRRDPAAATLLGTPPDRTVLELGPSPRGRPPRLVLVPTTHGTGAETSGVASMRAGGRKHLAVGSGLWADVAVVDPALAVRLPLDALRAGALETWCRAFSLFASRPVAGTTPSVSDAYAVAAGRSVVAAVDALDQHPAGVDVHVELAATASTTALGWTGLGRDPHGARLWQAQNELSALAGLPKSTALPALVAAYVAVGTERDSTLGVAERIADFVDDTLPGHGPVVDRLRAWLSGLGTPTSAAGLVAPDLAARVIDRVAEAWAANGAEPRAAADDAVRMLEAAGITTESPSA